MAAIHKTAIVSPRAVIDETASIGPNVIVDDNVAIGAETEVYANAYLTGYTTIGARCQIHMGAVIGHDPQDFAFDRRIRSYVIIGDNTVIREYCTIHRGTKPETETRVGAGNFLMNGVHVAHNCTLGDNVIVANYTAFGGYVTVGDGAFISAGVGVHQFCSVGRLAMLSGNGSFSQNIPPFVIGLERNSIEGVNLVGLRRAGVSAQAVREIKQVYSLYFLSGKKKKDAVCELGASGFSTPEALEFITFLKETKRPIASHRKMNRFSQEE